MTMWRRVLEAFEDPVKHSLSIPPRPNLRKLDAHPEPEPAPVEIHCGRCGIGFLSSRLLAEHCDSVHAEPAPPEEPEWYCKRHNAPKCGTCAEDVYAIQPEPEPAPESAETPRCQDFAPAGYAGHWRDYHRGHGCDKDPSRHKPAPREEPDPLGQLAEEVREACRSSRAVTRAELEEDIYAALRLLEDR